MSTVKKFNSFLEKYTTGAKTGSSLISALKDVKAAIAKADDEDLEKARYILADIKSAIEKKLKRNED